LLLLRLVVALHLRLPTARSFLAAGLPSEARDPIIKPSRSHPAATLEGPYPAPLACTTASDRFTSSSLLKNNRLTHKE
jgi:hypothetical protein